MVPFIITMLIILLGVYYLTIFLHFFGIIVLFKKAKINPIKALIPFYYWFRREITK
jgi:hypothetical protein